uniref:STAS domain-containing protein n=1 Tax=Magnetococcus massalia (strain MO-1) TaxID=451514 RepID=A0A1S7LMQ5_MAGMO|nr:Protein of unknown function [Candidatus Magnetococcus massalia]
MSASFAVVEGIAKVAVDQGLCNMSTGASLRMLSAMRQQKEILKIEICFTADSRMDARLAGTLMIMQEMKIAPMTLTNVPEAVLEYLKLTRMEERFTCEPADRAAAKSTHIAASLAPTTLAFTAMPWAY